MIAALFFFTIIIVLPYYAYFKKRLKDSNDKDLFIKENLYQSTIWIILLVLIPVVLVNMLASDEIENEIKPGYDEYGIRDFEDQKQDYKDDKEFIVAHINKFSSLINSDIRKEKFKSYLNDSLDQDDPQLKKWALAYFHTRDGNYDSARFLLSEVNDDYPFKNYTLAVVSRLNEQDSIANNYLLNEITLTEGYKKKAYQSLSSELEKDESLNLLKKILAVSGSEAYLDYHLTRKILFLNNEFGQYYKVIIRWFIYEMNAIGIIAAFLILIVWMFYLIRLNFFKKTDFTTISLILLSEMILCFLVFLISDISRHKFGFWGGFYGSFDLFFYSVFGIGAVEEIVKFIPLFFIFLSRKNSLEPYEYILFASTSAMGFAFIENIMYFEEGSFGSIIHGRALLSAVGHMMFSSLFAYGLVLSKYKYKNMNIFGAFFLFWFLASLSHGLYNYWLFENLIFFFILYFFLIARVWITIVNNSLNNSSKFAYSGAFHTTTLKFQLTFLLTAILMFEYVLVAFIEGADSANGSIIAAAFSGSFLIMFLGSKLTSVNLIKKHWAPINYSINPFTDDIVSQNFIGQKVYFSSYYKDRGLIEYTDDGLSGTIVGREILLRRKPTALFSYQDSEWFLVRLDKALDSDEHYKDRVMIKFKESHSSLNAKKFFLVQFLMIPKKIPQPKRLRKNFLSLGWVFLRTKAESSSKIDEHS